VEEYDGIPVHEVPIEEVDWLHRGDYIRCRSARKGRKEFDVEPAWAIEAVLDPGRLVVLDPASKSGRGLKVVGWSAGAGRVLTVLLISKTEPTDGHWWGVNAWAANSGDARRYRWRK
jgi:hypothetical protein